MRIISLAIGRAILLYEGCRDPLLSATRYLHARERNAPRARAHTERPWKAVAILNFAILRKIPVCTMPTGERGGTGNYETLGIPLKKEIFSLRVSK